MVGNGFRVSGHISAATNLMHGNSNIQYFVTCLFNGRLKREIALKLHVELKYDAICSFWIILNYIVPIQPKIYVLKIFFSNESHTSFLCNILLPIKKNKQTFFFIKLLYSFKNKYLQKQFIKKCMNTSFKSNFSQMCHIRHVIMLMQFLMVTTSLLGCKGVSSYYVGIRLVYNCLQN